MAKYTRIVCASLVAAVMLSACSKDKTQDTLAQDSALNGDLQLATGDTSAPGLSDVATNTAPAPSTSTSSSKPASKPKSNTTSSGNTVTSGSKESALGTIGAGSTLNMTSNERVCTNNHKVGDRVSATVGTTVSGSNGASIPRGATANLEITQLKRSENARDDITMGFAIRSVTFGGHTYPVEGTTTHAAIERVRNESKGKDAQKVATGAAVGAVLGQVLGKNTKSTVIGGAVGAAAGAGAAVATANYEGCVPSGGQIVVTLDNAIQVHR
jgi:hypothetical protein